MNKYRDQYHWKLIYFDAFAGAGSGNVSKEYYSANSDMFRELEIQPEELTVYKGAAERVLNITKRGFDFYYFIDIDKEANRDLEKKLQSFSTKGNLIFRVDDANKQIIKLADSMKKNNQYHTLLLLDPFGMQVQWNSIQQLAKLHVDLWILIPTGVIINRLLDKKGELVHINKLTSFFGLSEQDIRNFFYKEEKRKTLFGEDTIVNKIEKPIKQITNLYIKCLKNCFEEVTDEPLEMKNSTQTPIFHFAFASQNATAKKIASQIIGKSK
jgi:three-Cys-motif partner protein